MNKTTLNSQKEKHSMLSLRRATFRRQRARRGPQHFYPRSPCGERRCQTLSDCRYTAISIHALLAESDLFKNHIFFCHSLFLSTLSLRRATQGADIEHKMIRNFYPRSPCGERRHKTIELVINVRFLSTLSLRRATSNGTVDIIESRYFYPRSPCGERLIEKIITFNPPVFLSTLSLRRATVTSSIVIVILRNFYPRSPCGERPKNRCTRIESIVISIHALLAESDFLRRRKRWAKVIFLSTLSLRRATLTRSTLA